MSVFCNGDLRIERCQPGPDLVRLDWTGRGDLRSPDDVLTPFLSRVLEQARDESSSIEMHFEHLECLNASTVAVLVHFLRKARGAGVQLHLTYRPTIPWQRSSFEAMRVFEHIDKLVHVVPVTEV